MPAPLYPPIPHCSLIRRLCIFLATIYLSALLPLASLSADPPVRLIFDTDITGDVDDVLALAMCHALADLGACKLMAVTISKQNPLTASFVDAINTWYGRPDIPIGVVRDPAAQKRESRFLSLAKSPDYPHDLRSNDEAREAVDLLREQLAGAADISVTIASVGIASNLANLLHSAADDHSPMKGADLVRAKVKSLVLMAGAFGFANGSNYHLEANVINGIGYMQTVAKEWPEEVPVFWSGYEIGENLSFPRASVAEDFSYCEKHPVREAYLLHSGPDHERPSWDQSAVLQAVWPQRGYFGLSAGGRVKVESDGFTHFLPADGKKSKSVRDHFLTMNPIQRARVMEAIVQLSTRPPQLTKAR